MTEPQRSAAPPEEAPDTLPGHSGMPTWVKVFVVLGALLVVFVVVQMLTGGDHGPGRHGS